uniref:Antifreeze protein type IV n=1 Tax=Acanthochromis polyacanthus TaxID=80966 RepID=A0A3Q1HBL5_9TELE
MKSSLVAAIIVVLAVAHGYFSPGLVQFLQYMGLPLSPRTYMEDSKTKIQPLLEKFQAEATKLQEQVKPFIASIEDQMKPLTENFNAQVRPLTDMMEKFFETVKDQTKALMPPQ